MDSASSSSSFVSRFRNLAKGRRFSLSMKPANVSISPRSTTPSLSDGNTTAASSSSSSSSPPIRTGITVTTTFTTVAAAIASATNAAAPPDSSAPCRDPQLQSHPRPRPAPALPPSPPADPGSAGTPQLTPPPGEPFSTLEVVDMSKPNARQPPPANLMRGGAVDRTPDDPLPPRSPPGRYERKALPAVPPPRPSRPDEVTPLSHRRSWQSMDGTGTGSMSREAASPASTAPASASRPARAGPSRGSSVDEACHRRPRLPPSQASAPADVALSISHCRDYDGLVHPTPRSANKILRLTGMDLSTDLVITSPTAAATPSLNNSSAKIRQLMGADVGGSIPSSRPHQTRTFGDYPIPDEPRTPQPQRMSMPETRNLSAEPRLSIGVPPGVFELPQHPHSIYELPAYDQRLDEGPSESRLARTQQALLSGFAPAPVPAADRSSSPSASATSSVYSDDGDGDGNGRGRRRRTDHVLINHNGSTTNCNHNGSTTNNHNGADPAAANGNNDPAANGNNDPATITIPTNNPNNPSRPRSSSNNGNKPSHSNRPSNSKKPNNAAVESPLPLPRDLSALSAEGDADKQKPKEADPETEPRPKAAREASGPDRLTEEFDSFARDLDRYSIAHISDHDVPDEDDADGSSAYGSLGSLFSAASVHVSPLRIRAASARANPMRYSGASTAASSEPGPDPHPLVRHDQDTFKEVASPAALEPKADPTMHQPHQPHQPQPPVRSSSSPSRPQHAETHCPLPEFYDATAPPHRDRRFQQQRPSYDPKYEAFYDDGDDDDDDEMDEDDENYMDLYHATAKEAARNESEARKLREAQELPVRKSKRGFKGFSSRMIPGHSRKVSAPAKLQLEGLKEEELDQQRAQTAALDEPVSIFESDDSDNDADTGYLARMLQWGGGGGIDDTGSRPKRLSGTSIGTAGSSSGTAGGGGAGGVIGVGVPRHSAEVPEGVSSAAAVPGIPVGPVGPGTRPEGKMLSSLAKRAGLQSKREKKRDEIRKGIRVIPEGSPS